MTPYEVLAEKLNKCQYGNELSKDNFQFAKDNCLLVVYGYSDDVICIDGFITDEVSSETVFLKDWKYGSKDVLNEINKMDEIKYFLGDINQYLPLWFVLKAKYPDEEGWEFDISFPKDSPVEYAKFLVLEGEEIYGQGLVINLMKD